MKNHSILLGMAILCSVAWSHMGHTTPKVITADFSHLPVGYGDFKAAPPATPAWANWNLKPFVLKVQRSQLQDQVYAFGINCTAGKSCSRGFAATPVMLVRLVARDEHLLLVDSTRPLRTADPALEPIARWKIVDQDENFLYATPDLGASLAFAFDLDSQVQQQETRVQDRFFHDFRSDDKGLWFHETIRYETLPQKEGSRPTKGADTFTVYLLTNPFHEGFKPKAAIESAGYFTTTSELQDSESPLYGPRNPEQEFNPDEFKAIRWAQNQTIEWVVDSRCPESIFPLVQEGITAWNSLLSGVKLVVRRALPDEELDTPYKNVLFYEPGEGIRGGVANFSYHPQTGETFRAAVLIMGPEKFQDSLGNDHGTTTHDLEKERDPLEIRPKGMAIRYGGLTLQAVQEHFSNPHKAGSPFAALTKAEQQNALRGVVGHEVGHTLGLRHNFRGHTYVEDLETYPAGSSIMDYPKYFQNMKIGPYDAEAINWGYAEQTPSGKYAFCTDEKAGWSFFELAHDPQCQRWAPPTKDYFKDIYAEAKKLVEHYLPLGMYETENDFSVFDLGLILSYLRGPEAEYYDAIQFAKVNDLIHRIGALPAESSLLGNFPYWSTMFVSTMSFSSQFRNDRLPLSTMFQSRNLDSLIVWISRNPGKASLSIREDTVLEIKTWATSPYGKALYKKLLSRLEQEAQTSADLDVRVENEYLLEKLNTTARGNQ